MDKIAKLMCVTAVNNNKYYNMKAIGDKIEIEYGRVGGSVATGEYPISKWDSLYNSKIKKGYKDITEFQIIEDTSNFLDISDNDINRIVSRLQAYAKGTIKSNYTISSEAVTQKQVDRAQEIINDLVTIKNQNKIDLFNKSLLELYTVIPRKMNEVKYHLVYKEEDQDRFIDNEQSLLDVMAGQVSVSTIRKDTDISAKNILEALEIEIYSIDNYEKDIILSNLGESSDRYRNAWKVRNLKTEKKFTQFVETAKNKTTKLFWHGSRNENWWNILGTGLLIRPSGVVLTGTMFGKGTYFSDKARKSIGYTSTKNSYWAHGKASEGLLGLFEVHIGNQIIKQKHESWMSQLNLSKLKEYGDYDSFFAVGGIDLINNEYIVYSESQTNIRYLVEIQ